MTKEQVLAYLKALEQQEVRLEEGEFTTSEYAESEGIKMGAALKRLKVMEKKQ